MLPNIASLLGLKKHNKEVAFQIFICQMGGAFWCSFSLREGRTGELPHAAQRQCEDDPTQGKHTQVSKSSCCSWMFLYSVTKQQESSREKMRYHKDCLWEHMTSSKSYYAAVCVCQGTNSMNMRSGCFKS